MMTYFIGKFCLFNNLMVINKLDKERYDWFMNAMKIAYPKGHKWIK